MIAQDDAYQTDKITVITPSAFFSLNKQNKFVNKYTEDDIVNILEVLMDNMVIECDVRDFNILLAFKCEETVPQYLQYYVCALYHVHPNV